MKQVKQIQKEQQAPHYDERIANSKPKEEVKEEPKKDIKPKEKEEPKEDIKPKEKYEPYEEIKSISCKVETFPLGEEEINQKKN